MIQIIELAEAPASLKELVTREASDISTIKAVVFGAYMEHMDGTMGTYCPELKTIYIDLGNALNEQSLYNRGMMFIPSIVCSLVWAIGHEVQHALQLEAEPRLIEFETLPQSYEDGAMEYGEEVLLKWAHTHKIPLLDELGWLGKQLIVMINTMYTKHPEVTDEVDLLALGAAAPVDAVLANWKFTDKGKEVIIKDIDEGRMGIKVAGVRYLTAHEFLGL